jgi:flavorubredoxin
MSMNSRPLAKDVFWVGAQDWDRRLFDSLIPLPDGTSYNAYLVKGSDKTVLIDAVDPAMLHVLEEHLKDVPRVEYLVANHAEQDHSGGIPWVLKRYPEAVLLCSDKAKSMLVDHLDVPAERVRVVADDERLTIGGRTLRFIYTPWVHWPETMSTYLEEEGILFSCDWFGSHLAASELFVDEIDSIYEGAKRYYAEIMMPFRKIVRQNLEKIRGLEVRLIAPSHGPVYRRPELIVKAYEDWTDDLPHNEVVIPWVTMHGSTAVMVERLVRGLAERDVKVRPFNLAVADIGKLAMALVDAGTLVAAGPTVHTGPHPMLYSALVLANALRPRVRFAGIVGSYGWAGRMVEMSKAALGNLKVEFLEPVVCRGLPRAGDLEALDRLAADIARRHAEAGFKK